MSKLSVCIDAGHGGTDPGAVNGKRQEKNDTLRVAKRLKKVLEKNGVKVYMTRTTDVYNSPADKAAIGNKTGADYFISIHRNASDNKTAHGVEILLYSNTGLKHTIAVDILKQWKRFGFSNRGCKTNPGLAVLRRTEMPAMLLEIGFITNKDDNKIFDDNFYAIVNDIARAILVQFGIPFKTITQIEKEKIEKDEKNNA